MKAQFRFLVFLLGCGYSILAANGQTWFVSLEGDDSAPGTRERPFLSIQRALKQARRPSTHSDRKIIKLNSGRYLNSSILLGPEDSGLELSAVEGATPVLAGGCEIGGFKPDGQFYSAALPTEVSADFRLLVVNGRLAPRARFPGSGTIQHLSNFDVPWMGTYGGGWKRKPTEDELTTLKVDPQTLGRWFEPQNAELTIYHEWDESMVGVASYDPATGIIRFTGETGHPPGAFGNHSFVIWNTRDGMTQPGQWYVDREQRKIIYWPLPGETPERLRALIPTTKTILQIQGRPDAPVRDVTIEGLTFTVNNTPLKAGGFGAYAFDGAITATHVKGLRLAGLKILNVAGQGIKLSRADDSQVSACEIASTGAGGILARSSRLVIQANQVHDIGRIYPSGIAISCNGTNNEVIGNLVHHTPYVGITCNGWHARIEQNRIESVMETLHDGAGIYLGGTGHIIRGNFCAGIGQSVFDRKHAYYMDEHVRDCLLESNVALECPSPLHNHIATNNVIANNIFVNHGDVRLSFYRCAEHQLKNNLVWAAGKIEVYRPEAVDLWTNNFFYSGAHEVLGYPVERYSPGKPAPLHPPGLTVLPDLSLEIDPRGKVTLPEDSLPARAGLRSLDLRQSGTQPLTVQRAAEIRTHPNIVFLLIDDMGYGDMSCYGGHDVRTVHLDRLASEGLRFTQFSVASPICSPSRTGFTTGQYPARWRITSYLASRRENERRGMAQWLDPSAPTLARLLHQAGYATGHFGKWHMGGQRDVGEAPLITQYGFDKSLTQFEGLGDRLLPLCDACDGKPPRRYALGSDKLGRGKITWLDRSKITGAFVSRAVQFMEEAKKSGKPFYVNIWPDDVHSPFFPPCDLRGDGTKRQLYLGVVKAMDQQFAPLFDYLRNDPQLRTNTILIVASDNGPEPGAGKAGPFRGHKGNLYEGGFREPFIVWAPGLMAAAAKGTVNERSVISGVDLLPSLAQLAGVALPAGVNFDGEDFSQTLLGHETKTRSHPLFWNRPPDRPGPADHPWPDLAIREGDWKLLMMEDGSRPELYNLLTDPGETRNLADAQPAVVERLRRKLAAWRKTVPATFDLRPAGPGRRSNSRP